MRFFEGAFSDPSNWVSNPHPDPTPSIGSYATSNLMVRTSSRGRSSRLRWSSQKVSQPTIRGHGLQR